MPTLSFDRRTIEAQPVVFVTRHSSRHELAATIGAALGAVFPYTQKAGLVVAGPPFTRYTEVSGEMFVIDVGMPVTTPVAGDGELHGGTLASGPVLVALHGGSYDSLGETYTAMEEWMAKEGVRASGAPWESYITDPGNLPDPADWRTEVYWPIAE